VPPGSVQSLWSSDASVTPRVGDVAKRGPNWRWGDQDCGEQEIGLVVDCSPWCTAASQSQLQQQQQQQQSDAGLAVSVMWKDGSRNVYRWGVQQQYDITVLQRSDVSPTAAADATRSSSSTTVASTASTTAAAITTSAAIVTTAAAAADEHAQAAALPLLLALLLQAVDAMHTTSTAHSAAKGAASGEQAVLHSSTREALAAAQTLLEQVQLLLTADGSTTTAATAAVSTDQQETAASSDEFVGASGQRRRWNWSDCSHSVAALLDADTVADGTDAATAAAATAAAAAEVDLTLDPAHCFTNLQCTSGREPEFSCTVQQGADRGWGVALTTVGWARFTGVHTWMVHLDSVR
jgi:Mib_herc2